MLLLPSYRELRFSVGKRIALLSACWEQRFSFLKFGRGLVQSALLPKIRGMYLSDDKEGLI